MWRGSGHCGEGRQGWSQGSCCFRFKIVHFILTCQEAMADLIWLCLLVQKWDRVSSRELLGSETLYADSASPGVLFCEPSQTALESMAFKSLVTQGLGGSG